VTPLQLGTLVSAMANGGKLLVPQIAHNTKEANKMGVKVRRQLPITTDVWQRMVPGMVGAVNYGTARKSYDPTQTVVGKTGTCIGSAGWVGSFTSYAPLANPRLAVVVIAQGTDGRRHFPVAVAGEIYRELNHRFGTAINLQVASTVDDEEKEVSDAQEAADADANGDATETTTNGETTKAATATATPVTTNPVAPAAAKPATPEPRNTVKRVLMPLEKKPVDAPSKSTTNSKSTTTTQTPATVTPGTEQRPRRIQP